MKKELEMLFFESTIIDIDLSRWESYLQLCVLCRWFFLNGEAIPSDDIKLVKFKGVKEFNLRKKPSDTLSNDISRGIEVNGAVYSQDHKAIHLDAADFEDFYICFNDFEISSLSRIDISTAKSILPKEGLAFIRPDIEKITDYIRSKK